MTPSNPVRLALALLLPLGFALSCTDAPDHLASPAAPALERTTGVRLLLVSGDNQPGALGAPLLQPVVLRVVDKSDHAIAGANVEFIASSGTAAPRSAKTDAQGLASTVWTLGSAAGTQVLRVSGMGGTLVVNARALRVAALRKISGDGQTGAPGATLPQPLVVQAVDAAGTAVPGFQVAWASPDGGTFSPAKGVTGTDGKTQTSWVLAATTGTQTARATGSMVTPVAFTATAKVPDTAGPPVAMYVLPNPVWLAVGDTARMRTVFLDAKGRVVPGPKATWKSMSYYASVDTGGLVTGLQAQAGGIQVQAGQFRVWASVNPWKYQERYGSPRPWLYVVPELSYVAQNDSVHLTPLRVDASGKVANVQGATWSTPAVGSVRFGNDGWVTLRTFYPIRVYAQYNGLKAFADLYPPN